MKGFDRAGFIGFQAPVSPFLLQVLGEELVHFEHGALVLAEDLLQIGVGDDDTPSVGFCRSCFRI